MNKILSLLVLSGVLAFVGCGPANSEPTTESAETQSQADAYEQAVQNGEVPQDPAQGN